MILILYPFFIALFWLIGMTVPWPMLGLAWFMLYWWPTTLFSVLIEIKSNMGRWFAEFLAVYSYLILFDYLDAYNFVYQLFLR